jgi:pimeloyl-ACP methyl ester carboxylesterase
MAHPGTLHTYTRKLVAFEHGPKPKATHTLLWIGGLGDGLLTVQYPGKIAAALPPSWRVVEVLLSSSYKGWGTGSLERDARELGECVGYFRGLKEGGKIVLMGHSTGCQDTMEYLVGAHSASNAKIDGAVLQGGVSDREAWVSMLSSESKSLESFNELVKKAKDMIDQGKGKEVMGRENNIVATEFNTSMTAYRTYSLLAEGGDDDYFSSDLSDNTLRQSFGRIPKEVPVCFVIGSEDPYLTPSACSAEQLMKRWTDAVKAGGGVVDEVNGGFIKGAHHNLNDDPEDVVADLVGRVTRFLENVESGFPEASRL